MAQSFIGTLLLPDLGGLVADTLSATAAAGGGGAGGGSPSSQFFDTDSIFGVLRANGTGSVSSDLTSALCFGCCASSALA